MEPLKVLQMLKVLYGTIKGYSDVKVLYGTVMTLRHLFIVSILPSCVLSVHV